MEERVVGNGARRQCERWEVGGGRGGAGVGGYVEMGDGGRDEKGAESWKGKGEEAV